MIPVVLCRAETVTALGDGLASLWQGLLDGCCGLSTIDRFPCDNYMSRLGAVIPGLQAEPGASLHDPLLERLAGLIGPVPADCRLLVASTKGEVDCLEQACRQGVPVPMSCLTESLLAKISRRFALDDPGSNINAACASSTIALARGAALIAAGTADAVLIYGADILSEFVFSGFSGLQALAPDPCRPFDRQRKGLNLGEAGVALLLMSEKRAARSGEPLLARVAGWGAANDAHHVTAPARDGSGLIRACRQALHRSAVAPQQLAAINAHGTATLYNDAMELTAFGVLFGDRLPPLHGIKGSLGHCLGAAGGVEIAIASCALRAQLLPGTLGCQDPEPSARGAVGSAAQPIAGEYLLCTNSGFGGVNGAVVLQRGQA